MGIGRRDFLRLTSLALTGLVVDPLKAVLTHDNVYVNKKLGILFHKPNDWGFLSVKDFGKIKNEQIIGEGLGISKAEIWEDLGDPICMATKYFQDDPKWKGVFSPTITLHITPKEELKEVGAASMEEVMDLSEIVVSHILKEYQVVKRYEPYTLSEVTFYEYDAEYLFEHVDIPYPLKAELKVLKAEHNGFYYDFNCHQSKAQNQIADREFQKFKESIRLI